MRWLASAAVIVTVSVWVVSACGAAAKGGADVGEGFEISCPFQYPSITEANNGDVLLMHGNRRVRSSDGGRTWSEPEEMGLGVSSAIRLASGKIGGHSGMTFCVSEDDGNTWEKRGDIAASADLAWTGRGVPNFDVLMQTKSGRIFLPVRGSAAASSLLARESAAQGIYHGAHKNMEAHAHRPEADYSFVYFSDDEGRTWKQSEGTVMIWKDKGFGGMWPADEPCAVELLNGDVMMFFRTTLGRVYTSRSGPVVNRELLGGAWSKPDAPKDVINADPGVYWDYPEATELAGAYTPCRVRRMPTTGDLLLVWNQVSADEMRGGHSRGRMSCAISRDDGATWEHFRTIDRAVLAPAGRVAPEPEPAMARALPWIGEVPDNWGHLDYPNVGFHKDTVIVVWGRAIPRPLGGRPSGWRLRVAPVSWFYEDEPPYEPAQPTPKLIIGDPGVEVPGLYIDGRFLVNLTDVAKALGREVEMNMVGTLHQALTALRVKPVYDREGMKDPSTPVLRVTVQGE